MGVRFDVIRDASFGIPVRSIAAKHNLSEQQVRGIIAAHHTPDKTKTEFIEPPRWISDLYAHQNHQT